MSEVALAVGSSHAQAGAGKFTSNLPLGGADLEAKDARGNTAFLHACLQDSAEAVAALVEAGCDTAVTSSDGETGLMLAAQSGSAATVQARDAHPK